MIIIQLAVYSKLLYKSGFVVAAALCLIACAPSGNNSVVNASPVLVSDTSIKYAKRFSVADANNYKALFLYGNKDIHDTTSVFVLYRNEKPSLAFKNTYYIKVPVNNVASLSSIYGAMITKLGLDSKIIAIESVDYYNNPSIVKGVKEGKIKELAKGPEMNVEQTLLLNPDLILTFGMGDPKKDVQDKIANSKIPVAISLDHLEEHPLARAEWIKFVACFFGKELLADSLFEITENNYMHLKEMCDSIKIRPSVLTEIKYADAWYVPGGTSFMSHLISDAGAEYIWKDEKRSGSIPLSFEQVYTKAQKADYWLNLFININSKKDLLAFDERYALFNAFSAGNLYNNTRISNAQGYSDYWENGMSNPDELLKDLIKIMHPHLLPQHELKYYKKIN